MKRTRKDHQPKNINDTSLVADNQLAALLAKRRDKTKSTYVEPAPDKPDSITPSQVLAQQSPPEPNDKPSPRVFPKPQQTGQSVPNGTT